MPDSVQVPTVRLVQLTVRMPEVPVIDSNSFKAANMVLDQVPSGRDKAAKAQATRGGKSPVRACLSHYDDEVMKI